MPITLTPESPEQLRKRLKEYEGVELEFGLHPILQGLARALDRIEELEGQNARAVADYDREFAAGNELAESLKTALSELSALKAKMEKVREWATQDHWDSDVAEEASAVLAILDGKEG